MASSTSGAKDRQGGRIRGARADFAASIGRKVTDVRDLLAALGEDPSSKATREELRRRLHALSSGAKLLRFESMNRSLQEALAVLDRGAAAGGLREPDVAFVARTVAGLPTLASSEMPPPADGATADAATAGGLPETLPAAVLIVGDEGWIAALKDPPPEEPPAAVDPAPPGEAPSPATKAPPTSRGNGARQRFECERVEDVDTALDTARLVAPDLLLVDADLPGAGALVESIFDDPLTHAVPVVVVGTFVLPEEPARYIALGAARTLAKPVPPEALRAACEEIVRSREGPTMRVTLGEMTLEQLAERLAEELKRGLVDSVDRSARSHRLALGDGAEVLGALWGAIARVQEIVTQKAGGAVRFGGEAPEGAIALAPSLHHDVDAAERVTGHGRGTAADVDLTGRRVVVADDDPGVTWFVSDLLRSAGCDVKEALDGTTALESALRTQPELIVSDILMPGLDGFALCRAVRRDVALRQTPVILLSWKEDLLQRVRELGASAAAYMRKETGSSTVLARVREVLRPRARLEMRLKGEGELRGRLDGITPRVLLELACRARPNMRIALRDATHLYEIEVRDGAPRKVTRTASDGSHRSGERALASLLGVGAGRFVITPPTGTVRAELRGSLAELLAPPIARARGALFATTGPRMTQVERISFDGEAIEEYLRATPEPTRTLVRRLSQGTTPRHLLLEASPSLIEDVLADLAARGAIRAVEGSAGVDLWTPAVDAALRVLGLPLHPDPADEVEPEPSEPLPQGVAVPAADAEEIEGVPSSLEDAVMREISERLSDSRAPPAPEPPPIVKPSDLLVRRPSEPDISDEVLRAGADLPTKMPSLPPDAIVPETSSSEDLPVSPSTAGRPESEPQAVVPASDITAQAPETTAEPDAPPADAGPGDAPAAAAETEGLASPPAEAEAEAEPAAPDRETPPATHSRSLLGFLLIFGAMAAMILAALRWAGGEEPAPAPPAAAETTAPAASMAPPAPAPPPARAVPSPAAAAASAAPAATVAPDDLPPGAEVPPGFGLLEVRASAGSSVRVDGKSAGAGPLVSTPVSPGYHEVHIKHAGHESSQVIEVRAGKTAHVRSTLP